MRARLVVALLLGGWALPAVALAQHPKEAAPAGHAPAAQTHETGAQSASPAPSAKPMTRPEAKSAVKPGDPKAGADTQQTPAAKVAPSTELEAALERISQRLDGADVGTPPRRPSSRPTRTPAAASFPRIRLNWRTTLVWPSDLATPTQTQDADPSRVSLDWK